MIEVVLGGMVGTAIGMVAAYHAGKDAGREELTREIAEAKRVQEILRKTPRRQGE